jgi:hypothetical protein
MSGASTGLVDFIIPTSSCVRLLHCEVQRTSDALESVKLLVGDIELVRDALDLLCDVEETTWGALGVVVAVQVMTIMIRCEMACDMIRSDLHQGTIRPLEDGLFWPQCSSHAPQNQWRAACFQMQACSSSLQSLGQMAMLCG